MHRDQEPQTGVETDPRFPSGAWEGFYVQRDRRTPMELHLRGYNLSLRKSEAALIEVEHCQ